MGLLGSILHSWESWALTRMLSLSPLGEITGGACCRRGDAGKVKLFLLPSPYVQTHSYAPTLCQNLSTENLDYHKASLSCERLSKVVFSRGSQTVAKRAWNCLQVNEVTIVKTEVCTPITQCTWVEETPPASISIWYWIPQLPQRHFCLWIDARLLKVDTMRDVLFGYLADITFSYKLQKHFADNSQNNLLGF